MSLVLAASVALLYGGGFTSREVSVGADPWKLGGTLLLPQGKPPWAAVVLVHGPGPNDRDETVHATHIFRDLAEGLASRGIAVLRYDKRTKVYGQKMSEMEFTTEQETVADVLSALTLLRSTPGIPATKVFLIAHSLGGYLAPRIAARDPKIRGIVFLAANARPVEDMALEQNTYVANLRGEPSAEAKARLDSLRAEVQKVKKLAAGKANPPIVMGLPAAWLLDLKGYNAPAAAKKLTVPMLFLQGERDFQVTMTDFRLWSDGLRGNSAATFHSYPSLNHLFITGPNKSIPAEYRLGGNFEPEVTADIAAWLQKVAQ